MDEMHNYSLDKERAIKQILEMNQRATASSFDDRDNNTTRGNQQVRCNSFPFMHLPFDSDTLTLLAIMFILYNENCDMLLIFALVYILI